LDQRKYRETGKTPGGHAKITLFILDEKNHFHKKGDNLVENI
jgi:hypothetical protein